MKKYLATLLLALVATQSFSQSVKRMDNEDAQAFVNRLIPEGMVLVHHLVETNRWSYPQKMIVACYGYNDSGDVNTGSNRFARIEGHVYLPTAPNNYRDLSFGPIEEEGCYPEILSVFFANVDKDTTKEMIVLCSYETKNYDFEGTAYKAYVYDNPGKGDKLVYLEDLSRQFYGMEGTWRDGKINRAKYKTAKEIRAKLKQMGY